jgi:hypothetical protein
MSQLQDLQELVEISIGGRDDAAAVTVIQAAINYAIILAALTFKPPELKTLSSLSYTASSEYLDISSVNWVSIALLKLTSTGKNLGFIPYDKLDVIIPSTLTDTKYYSLFGDKLFLRAIPSSTTALTMSALTLPSTLTSATDSIPFTGYDNQIVNWASMLTLAAFEEGDSAGMWLKVAETIGQPLMLGAKERDIIEGQQAYFDLALMQSQGGK